MNALEARFFSSFVVLGEGGGGGGATPEGDSGIRANRFVNKGWVNHN